MLATYRVVRLLLLMLRLETILQAPARGWGDGCLIVEINDDECAD